MFGKTCILHIFSVFSPIYCGLAPTHLFVTRIGPCDEFKGVISVSEMSVARNVYDFTVNGQINISENIANGWNVMGVMQKCQDLRNLDTCDYFKSFSLIRSGCTETEDSEDTNLYSMVFHYTQPRLKCPIEAGNYKIVGYPFFSEDNYLSVSESKISTSIFGYTYKLQGFNEDDDMIMCVEAHLQLLYIRIHDWIIDEREQTTKETNGENGDNY